MYTLKDMRVEIHDKVQALMTGSGVLHPEWITQDVMNDHADITGGDADFHRSCSRHTVREEVTKQINKIEKLEAERSQLSFQIEGFEHLQSHYIITRKGELLGVPTEQATDDELHSKSAEYRSMGKACYEHADEIDRYVELRANGLQGEEAS